MVTNPPIYPSFTCHVLQPVDNMYYLKCAIIYLPNKTYPHTMDEHDKPANPSRSYVVTSVRLDEERHRLVRLRLIEEHRGSFSDFVNRAMIEFLDEKSE